MTDFQTNQIVAIKSGTLSFGGALTMAVAHIFNMPSWVQMLAAGATILASFYAVRLSRINIKKTEAELKILRAKADQIGIRLDD